MPYQLGTFVRVDDELSDRTKPVIVMIKIPTTVKNELITLDQDLQKLGRGLYGKKFYGEYSDGQSFSNFSLELHLDGTFTLHFRGGILGGVENRSFGTQEASQSAIVSELRLFKATLAHQMRMVNA